MKKIFIVSIAILVLLGILFTSCSPAATTTAAKPTTTAAATTTAATTTTAANVINLRLSTWAPPQHSFITAIANPFAAELEKRTNGRVKVTVFPASALGKAEDQYNIAATGTADMAIFTPDYTPGQFPLTEVMEFPFMVESVASGTKLAQQMYTTYPALPAEYAPVKALATMAIAPMILTTTSKKVMTMADLKGLRIRVNSQMAGDCLKLYGGVPMLIAVSELYTALERGTIDGAIYNAEGAVSFKLGSLSKYVVSNVSFGNSACVFGINQSSWNKLPADVQDIITNQLNFAWLAPQFITTQQGLIDLGMKSYTDAGNSVYQISATEKALWKTTAQPVFDSWLKTNDSKGVKPMYDTVNKILAAQ